MIRRSCLDEIVWWIPCLCFFRPAYKAGQDQLGSRDRPRTNSHWLLGGDAVEAGEAGDASLASASSPWVGGRFKARFHWVLEDAAGDAPSFSSWAVSFWASWMAEMQGGGSLLLPSLSFCRDL